MKVDDDEAVCWAINTTVASHSKAILFYNDDEPCLIGDLSEVIRNLDVLVWGMRGPRIVLGVDVNECEQRIRAAMFFGLDENVWCVTVFAPHFKRTA